MIWVRGVEYGTAAQLAARLGPDVTVAMVRNWQQRDGLTRVRIGGRVYSPLPEAAAIELAKRDATRGRPRLDQPLPVAA